MFEVALAAGAVDDLATLRAFDRKAILNAIVKELTHRPTEPTRNRKLLVGVIPPFEAVPPVWQLQAGDFRVFYDVDIAGRTVNVRAVRRKTPHKRTEEIL